MSETVALVEALTAVLHSPQPDYREAGRLLSAAHALLRDQVACSTPLIEECVSRVLAAGAYGANGCLFALVPDDAVAAVLASVAGLPVHAVALPRSDPAGTAAGDWAGNWAGWTTTPVGTRSSCSGWRTRPGRGGTPTPARWRPSTTPSTCLSHRPRPS